MHDKEQYMAIVNGPDKLRVVVSESVKELKEKWVELVESRKKSFPDYDFGKNTHLIITRNFGYMEMRIFDRKMGDLDPPEFEEEDEDCYSG